MVGLLDGGEMKKDLFNIVKKARSFLIISVMIIGLLSQGIVFADDPGTNIIRVVPVDDVITSETFTIDIICEPVEPIKSFEFSLSFDPTSFIITGVSEGSFFGAHPTFFNSGTIDNSTGTLVDVYGLSLGSGLTVDSSGVLVTLTVEMVSEGSSSMDLDMVGLTNESSYLSVSPVNGTIIIDLSDPEITDIDVSYSDPVDTDPTFGWVNMSCSASAASEIQEVIMSISCPNGSVLERSLMQGSGNYWYWNSSMGESMFTTAGNYSFTITVTDASGNMNTSSVFYIEIPPNWDVNADGICDLLDFVEVSNRYGETGENGWIREDINNDGELSVLDLVMLSNAYKETW
jgi:hypothetical protein